MGKDAEPDEDVEDHSNGAGEVHGDGNWVEESKVDAVDTNKTESDQKNLWEREQELGLEILLVLYELHR